MVIPTPGAIAAGYVECDIMLSKEEFQMPISSIFDEFFIDSDKKLDILLRKENTEGRKTKKIDIDESLRRGKKLLEDL